MACRATLAHPTKLPDSEQQLRRLLLGPRHTRTPTEAQQLSSALAYFRFFQTRSKEVRGQLCRHLEYLAVPAGTVVYQAGTPADLFFLVLSGSLQCTGMGAQVGLRAPPSLGRHCQPKPLHCFWSGLVQICPSPCRDSVVRLGAPADLFTLLLSGSLQCTARALMLDLSSSTGGHGQGASRALLLDRLLVSLNQVPDMSVGTAM